jgi:hypothetical protein
MKGLLARGKRSGHVGGPASSLLQYQRPNSEPRAAEPRKRWRPTYDIFQLPFCSGSEANGILFQSAALDDIGWNANAVDAAVTLDRGLVECGKCDGGGG